MKTSIQTKPISYLQDSAEDVLKYVTQNREPLIITQNGEEKLVIVDIHSYQKDLETLAFLKILAFGDREIKAGKFMSADKMLDEMI